MSPLTAQRQLSAPASKPAQIRVPASPKWHTTQWRVETEMRPVRSHEQTIGTASFRARLAALPGGIQGALWMSMASFFFALIYVVIRRLTETVPIQELVLFRALLGMAFMAPWLMRSGLGALRTARWRMYIWRTLASYSGMLCWFYALSAMPLADATSLMFTLPLFAVLLAATFLGEHVGIDRWLATAVGFGGALIIIRPGFVEVGIAAAAALYTALSYAGSSAMTKSLVRTETSNAVVFYTFALLGIISVGPAIATWTTPALEDVSWIILFGVLSAVATQCVTRSFAAAPASVVVPFQFLKLPFVAAIALWWFSEEPDPWTWLGALVIFASSYAIVRREAGAARS